MFMDLRYKSELLLSIPKKSFKDSVNDMQLENSHKDYIFVEIAS